GSATTTTFGINVTDAQWGTLCQNVNADDQPGLQTAINTLASAGGRVFVPRGTCKLQHTLCIPPKVILEGESPNSSILQINTTGSMIAIEIGGMQGCGYPENPPSD